MSSQIINMFKPYDWQLAPLRDKSPVILLTGGAGGGKSKCAYEKLHAYLMKYPGATGLLLRKDKSSLGNSALLAIQYGVMGNDNKVVQIGSKSRFEYWNGSILAWGGMFDEKQREGLKSVGKTGNVDIVLMEEANSFTEDDFNLILTRMRGTAASWRQIILCTNPDHPQHWIKKRLIDGGEAAVYYSRASDNPNNPADYITTLNKLTGVQYERMVLGHWVQAEGVIYDTFDEEKHVVNSFPIKMHEYKQIIGGGDSNYPLPRAGIVIGICGNGMVHVFDELYEKRCETEQGVTWFEQKAATFKRDITIYHDPSDPQSITKYNGGRRLTCEKAQNAVIPGIAAVAALFKNNQILIHRGCPNLRTELLSYCWKKNKEGDQPEKKNDHLMDALRYAIYSYLPKTTKVMGKFF